MSQKEMYILDQDVKYLKGVGALRAKILGDELNVHTCRDLLYVFPIRYMDRTTVYRVSQLQEGMSYVQLRGRIVDIETVGEGRKQRLVATFSDGSGYMSLVWFNALRTVARTLKEGNTYYIIGKPSLFNGRVSMVHPEMEEDRGQVQASPMPMKAYYRVTEKMKRHGFSSHVLSGLVRTVFELVPDLAESLPGYLVAAYQLQPLREALYHLHFPRTADDLPQALHRVKFEELFYLQLSILQYAKHRQQRQRGFVFPHIGRNFMDFYQQRLPFPLTRAQQRVMKEIRKDFATGRQMNRLLQGDVGSGKTVVALMACLIAIDNGFQTCLMAPTEILAEQHLQTLRGLLGECEVRVELLTGSVLGARRSEILEGVADGSIQLLVGTHALIEPTVRFRNLGLAIVDEQHRFGVKQRAALWQKNLQPPHILVMTATPIPRTLAMTLYGDLDVSVIDELPPGRKPIKTIHLFDSDPSRLYEGIGNQLRQGHQVYVIYPLIEESEKMDLKDSENGYNTFRERFPDYRVARLHGRMKAAEKENIMHEFAAGKVQILVSTTVIEVGVNVPNATTIVIENAERFGLAQLHQLRGRVGRGADESYCILVTGMKLSDVTRRRIQTMVDTNDGFVIAEEDLKLRGPGDLEGTAQSGMWFELHAANITKDADLMAVAREAASKILAQDPQENLPQNRVLWEQLRRQHAQMMNFSDIS